MIRYRRDGEAVFDALSRHSRLRSVSARAPFAVICSDEATKALLERAIAHLPFQDRVGEPVSIVAWEGRHPEHPEWLGFQWGNEISLYYPAYRTVTTLIFTLFHEYGHWLQKHVLGDKDWESFPGSHFDGSSLRKASDVALLVEQWADEFGWFCVNPGFLQRERAQSLAYFDGLFASNNC